MLEPWGAIVFSSLLACRKTAGHCQSSKSVVKVVIRSMGTAAPPKGLSSRTRRTKGKERADHIVTNVRRCTSVDSVFEDIEKCALDDTRWTAEKRRVFIMPEIVPRRSQSYTYSMRTPKNSFVQLGRNSFVASHPVMQRRTAAGLSVSRLASSSAGTSTSDYLQRFLTFKSWPEGDFDLRKAWSLYTAALQAGALDSVDSSDLLDFVTRLVGRVEATYRGAVGLEELRNWGLRALEILGRMGTELDREQHYAHRCISARASALTCDLDDALDIIQHVAAPKMSRLEMAFAIPVYESVFLAMVHHQDIHRALTFLLDEWQNISIYISGKGKYQRIVTVASFRRAVHTALRDIESPAQILVEYRATWTGEQRTRIGELLMDVLNEANLPEDALDVLEQMQAQRLQASVQTRLLSVRTLARCDSFELAHSIFWSITDSFPIGATFKLHLSTGLYLFGREGNVERAEEYYQLLQKRGWVSAPDVAMLLHASAVQGDCKRVVALFHHFFPESSDEGTAEPNIIHYSTVIFAYAQRFDIDGMNEWLDRMAKAGIMPDKYVYSIVLQTFAKRGDLDSVSDVLDQMRAAGVTASNVAYTSIMGALARRKDPVATEAMFKRAVQDGVVPDRQMLVTLMNAHVEAGSWRGVIRVFDYLKTSRLRHLRLTPAVYNTLLKAYVLIGAPFSVVSALFDKLQDVKIRPDARTFALLVQSACDAGELETAGRIFQQMETISEHWQSSQHINAYVMTILMGGYLRAGKKEQAKAVYDDMIKRGIDPTAVTFASLINSYATEKTEQSLLAAENFLTDIINTDDTERSWETTSGSRAAALGYVYAPLMTAYAANADPENTERLYQSMLDAGGEPTLGLLTMLLDAYRRKGDIEAALELWPQILQLGMSMSRIDSLFGDTDIPPERSERRHPTLMCIPLSIYIDALSVAGMHLEIALTWKKLQMFGFTFDSHNWNHLAVALVRSGEVERAFETLEKVILPYQEQSEQIQKSRLKEPETPFLFDTPHEAPRPEEADAPANRRAKRREEAVETASAWLSNLGVTEEDLDDFAHPLHILHQISPSWNQWRPHKATLDILLWALTMLERGRIVKPLRNKDLAPSDSDEDQEEEKAMAKLQTCSEILDRIYTNCPQAVRIVQQHKRDRQLQDMRATSVG